jgi:DNA-binding transcriptional MerR regulator
MSRQRSRDAIESSEFVTIGELVRLTGARYSTLKFYTEEGMIPFEQKEENLTRRYKRAEAIDRLALIKRLKAEGRSIAEIKSLLGTNVSISNDTGFAPIETERPEITAPKVFAGKYG